MSKFLEISLPDFISCYISGGPHFNTSIIQTISGREIRQGNLDYAMHKYVIKNCRLSPEEMEEFNAFFLNTKGAEFAFRLKDYADFYAVKQDLNHCLENEQNVFILYKKYQYQNKTYLRKILKPVEGSVQVFVDEVEINHQLDSINGTVKIPPQLEQKQNLSASFNFDVPARFCCDWFSYQRTKDGSFMLEDIEIKEIYL
jgi:uncharacterized protein (TIGR02217 family)